VFTIAAAAVTMVNLDLFAVNVAIPSIGAAFGGQQLASLSWVLNAYAIVYAALLGPAGRAADRIGRSSGIYHQGHPVRRRVRCLRRRRKRVDPGGRPDHPGRRGALLTPASLGLLLASAPPARRAAAVRSWTASAGAAAASAP
jgi:MFS family permease